MGRANSQLSAKCRDRTDRQTSQTNIDHRGGIAAGLKDSLRNEDLMDDKHLFILEI